MSGHLHVENLTKHYGKEAAVQNVTFTLEPNTATALIGPNGAGKTTTLSMLTGLLNPTSGTIVVDGKTGDDYRHKMGFLSQYPQFYGWMSSREYMEMAARLSGVSARDARVESEKALDFVGLGDVKGKKISGFSGGMRQRLGLAQAIVHKPAFLFLDEPVSALDPIGRREILNLVKELQQSTTILYSTHILNDAQEMTDQLLFMRKGNLIEQGSLTNIQKKYEDAHYQIHFTTSEEAASFIDGSTYAAYQENHIAFIPIKEERPRMQEVLASLVASPHLTVTKAERSTASLEEIFLKVVNGK
ncbi:ATP-binding cassette domain-containing protein [Chryseomicrobium palamuruense]|uniref:ATP-binding cassette domain-containing protein n=1 Tax=Chryseomicrobium palamuruense TaxID=682973 RepID=A0ABV8URH5_9BACL